jgi:pyruvate dehydrogenase E1 component alpha subunit
MKINLTAQDLISFEEEVAECFNSGKIRAPIHLYNGNEDKIIKIFEKVNKEDYIFCSWRSHYQCLLKGVPRETLKKDILAGKSITLCYPEYNIFSSAIVTGSIPIANGRALAEKRKGSDSHVWCFVGDMSSETGSFHENVKYSVNHDLPITWVVEDNGKSVCTDTRKTWNTDNLSYEEFNLLQSREKVIYYKYETKYPHAGAGKRIQF